MMFLGVLCLAACALGQPAVYVSRSTLGELPAPYYSMMSPWVALAPEKDGIKKEFIIPAGPGKLPLASIMIEPVDLEKKESKDEEEIEPKKEEELIDDKDDEFKVEELDDEEHKEEKPKEEDEKKEMPKLRVIGTPGPVDIKFIKPPQFLTNLVQSLPITIPYDYPILGPIFGKPPAAPAPAPEPTPAVVRYRLAYPRAMLPRVPIIAKK